MSYICNHKKEFSMQHLIAPSLLSANFLNLEADIEMVNRSEANWFHCDVMDGRFVPNISFGIPVVQAIKKKPRSPSTST